MKKIFSLTLSVFLLISSGLNAQNPAPVKEQQKKIVITGGIAHIGDGRVIENSIIVLDSGKISMVADAKLIKLQSGAFTGAEIIDAQGKHVYPGFIALNSGLGLSEIEMVRATNDFAEAGNMNASARSAISYNTDSKVIPTVRSNGILMAQIIPQGGIISGSSSVMQLDAWNWEDAVYKMDEGVHLNWPGMRIYKAAWAAPEEEQRSRMTKNLNTITTFFKEARSYCNSSIEEKNLQFECMRGVFDGTKKLYVHCGFEREIIAAVNFCKEQKIKMVLVGGEDAWRTPQVLKENNVPVIITRTQAIPSREDEDLDISYKIPALLQTAGVTYAISESGFWQQRNLGFEAGQAVAYGISKEDALKAITLTPAQILGIDSTCGSIQEGKDATLIISAGDALDMLGNKIEYALIKGRQINLDNIQKQLYRKYCQKYGIKE